MVDRVYFLSVLYEIEGLAANRGKDDAVVAEKQIEGTNLLQDHQGFRQEREGRGGRRGGIRQTARGDESPSDEGQPEDRLSGTGGGVQSQALDMDFKRALTSLRLWHESSYRPMT